MDESILTTVKASLGIPEDYEHFDLQIISCINGCFTILQQLGIGPDAEFSITDDSTTWEEFIRSFVMFGDVNLQLIQQYICKRVRLMFDTSTISSYALSALQDEIREYEWRLHVMSDTT